MTPAPDITLRPWQAVDAPRMAELLNTPPVYRYLAPELPKPYTVEHARSFIAHCEQAENARECAIELNGEAVGTIGAQWQGHTARIGYWLGEAYWRRGIMSQALPLFLDQLPDRITQVEASVYAANTASRALLHRCGFVQQPSEGTEPAPDGRDHRVLLYSRSRIPPFRMQLKFREGHQENDVSLGTPFPSPSSAMSKTGAP